MWVRARGLAIEIADDPLEAWFEAMHPLWSRVLATRAFRRALRRRHRSVLQVSAPAEAEESMERGEREADAVDARWGLVEKEVALVGSGSRWSVTTDGW